MPSHIELFQRATTSEYGIAVQTNDRQLLRQQLYKARIDHGGFEDIVLAFPKREDELWLVKRHADK